MDEYTSVGNNLKLARMQMGLSLSEASELTGVSKTMLSQIERSESIPTIATIWKIANGLKLKFDSLLENRNDTFNVHSVSEIKALTDDNGKYKIYSVFPFSPSTGFEATYGVLEPGCNFQSVHHKNSISESLFVCNGSIELHVVDHVYSMNAGDFITFDPRLNHTYVNTSDGITNLFFIVGYQ